MEENRSKPPVEWPEPRQAGWRFTITLFLFGVVGLILALTGNEKHVIWLSVMMLIAAAASAISHWK